MGVDIGSAASKCVILKNGRDTVGSAAVPLGTGTSGPGRAVETALERAGLGRADMAVTVATGYGRNSLPGADFTVSELSCHAAGAHAFLPEAGTVVDIGGQDCKAIRLAPDGGLEGFVMNDKCAAGTGRFLEVMARVLELDVSQLADRSRDAERAVEISSTCTVFAESEVISRLSENTDIGELIAGIHKSAAARAAGLVRRVGLVEPLVMTGGVALNRGVVAALEKELGCRAAVPEAPQLNGAMGAALFAWKSFKKDREEG